MNYILISYVLLLLGISALLTSVLIYIHYKNPMMDAFEEFCLSVGYIAMFSANMVGFSQLFATKYSLDHGQDVDLIKLIFVMSAFAGFFVPFVGKIIISRISGIWHNIYSN